MRCFSNYKHMTKAKINIVIGGVTNSGKSRIAFLLKKLLRKEGFDVTTSDTDFSSTIDFDRAMNNDFDNVINNIKKNTKIHIKTFQIGNNEV